MSEFKMPMAFKAPAAPPPIKKAETTKKVEEVIKEEDKVVTEDEAAPAPEKDPPPATEKVPPPPAPVVPPRAREHPPVPYREPKWSGVPPEEGRGQYSLEVLKSGTIVETVALRDKGHFVVGRLTNCDLRMEHPSLSRYHAIIQYKKDDDDEQEKAEDDVGQVGEKGFYLYDLNSTHGTYHNKKRCFPETYYRLRVGHAIKFGGSTRMILLQGPEEDREDESEERVAELQKKAMVKREEKKRKAKEAKIKAEEDRDTAEQEARDKGVAWGFSQDAEDDEEEPDLAVNPFSMPDAENENLYLDDPKKTLRGWFEREGHELEYDCKETGYASFRCTVELPLEGGGILAEAEVKGGKKKEAVVQCALEACRILDRRGLLRQSNHESKKKKIEKKWEEDDFYASDDDEFLDRTGSIEKKRKTRMRMVQAGKDQEGAKQDVDTFDSLIQKKADAEAEIALVEKELEAARESERKRKEAASAGEEDDLDSFMASLKQGGNVDKATITKLKAKLAEFSKESQRLSKLIEIVRPTPMPAVKSGVSSLSDNAKSRFSSVLIGKRKGGVVKLKSIQVPQQTKSSASSDIQDSGTKKAVEEPKSAPTSKETELSSPVREVNPPPVETTLNVEQPPVTAAAAAPITPDSAVKGRQIPDHLRKVLQAKGVLVQREEEQNVEDMDAEEEVEEDEEEMAPKKRRKNRCRKGKPGGKLTEGETEEDGEGKEGAPLGDYDPNDPDYAVWMPPTGQTGDGRTSLNDKLGY